MVDYLATYITNRISRKILNLLVINPMLTIEEAIKDQVVLGIFLTDLNLVGGRSVDLVITKDMIYKAEKNKVILLIPSEHRRHSRMTSVQYIMRNDNATSQTTYSNYGTVISNPYEDTFKKNDGTTGLRMESNIRLVGSKYVIIEQDNISTTEVIGSVLKFEVEFAENFEGIARQYYPEMGRICIMAARMYIHTELDLTLDELLANNHTISDKLISKISSFEEAEDDYQEELDTLGKISFLNDREKMSEFIGHSV